MGLTRPWSRTRGASNGREDMARVIKNVASSAKSVGRLMGKQTVLPRFSRGFVAFRAQKMSLSEKELGLLVGGDLVDPPLRGGLVSPFRHRPRVGPRPAFPGADARAMVEGAAPFCRA